MNEYMILVWIIIVVLVLAILFGFMYPNVIKEMFGALGGLF